MTNGQNVKKFKKNEQKRQTYKEEDGGAYLLFSTLCAGPQAQTRPHARNYAPK